jgi:hypothetical protein
MNSPDERSDLADGSRNAIELPANRSRRRLGREQSEVVARTDFSEREEDTVHLSRDRGGQTSLPRRRKQNAHDCEGTDVLDEVVVQPGHDETEDSLHEQAWRSS